MYGAIPTDLNVTISKAPLTITAQDKLRLTNVANPGFTHLTTGFVNDDNESTALLTPPVESTTAVQSSPEGSYPITLSGATSDKYFITYVPGTLIVSDKTEQVIGWGQDLSNVSIFQFVDLNGTALRGSGETSTRASRPACPWCTRSTTPPWSSWQ